MFDNSQVDSIVFDAENLECVCYYFPSLLAEYEASDVATLATYMFTNYSSMLFAFVVYEFWLLLRIFYR